MITELVLASSNKKKIAELKALLPNVSLLSLKDIGFDREIEEPYFTFEENAAAKAKTIFEFCGKNVLADDSGICVATLNNDPGVFSARYAGEHATDQENLNKLLHELKGRTERRAFYKAVLCLIIDGITHYFEGSCHGQITEEPQGDKGFGYDPIFMPNGYNQTFGELPETIKHSISHRAQAMNELKAFLKGNGE
jgi:XTP/dITP diphosphohydrolase